ncbi:hypothetical protein [Pseudoxanthomonas sp. J35]|uniref:hypothetical protein n=1 Tax=Pseudoxanthomonas sp. J35 TaxID=935852 RepID=UPI00048BD128|nr:hypothetical protein [Pseudoxanthomonas sp. J35]
MNKKLILAAAAMFAGFAANASAANGNALTDCVDLGGNQEIVRSGGTQNFLLRDGDEHYLVGFRGDCASLPTTSKLEIITAGTANRLCATGTIVKTKRENCQVGKVESIDAEQFAARKKRLSR